MILPEKPVRIGEEWFDDYQARVQVHEATDSKRHAPPTLYARPP